MGSIWLTGVDNISVGDVFPNYIYCHNAILPYPGSSSWQQDGNGNYEASNFSSGNIGNTHGRWDGIYANNINANDIYYTGSKATYRMIHFLDNTSDTYGNGIQIGGGGLVVIGAGESSGEIVSGKSAGSEDLYLGADGAVYIYSNVNSGIGYGKKFTFAANGNFTAPGNITAELNISCGDLNASRVYGTQIYSNNTLLKPNTWRGYQTKQYTYQYTIPANGDVMITGSDLGVSTPSGYTPVAITFYNTDDTNVYPIWLSAEATGSSWVAILRSIVSSQLTHTFTVKILYLQNGNG